MTGTCVGWREENGYGFIRPAAGGADVFVHRRDIRNAMSLRQGQRVSFDIVEDPRNGKLRADSVLVVNV